jgi:hypothetical protein
LSGFASVEGGSVLERLGDLPISTWSKAQKPSIRHLGPTAQDFRRAFGLGVDARHIDSIDSEGVSLQATAWIADANRIRAVLGC